MSVPRSRTGTCDRSAAIDSVYASSPPAQPALQMRTGPGLASERSSESAISHRYVKTSRSLKKREIVIGNSPSRVAHSSMGLQVRAVLLDTGQAQRPNATIYPLADLPPHFAVAGPTMPKAGQRPLEERNAVGIFHREARRKREVRARNGYGPTLRVLPSVRVTVVPSSRPSRASVYRSHVASLFDARCNWNRLI